MQRVVLSNGVYDGDDVSIDEFTNTDHWTDSNGETHKISEMSVAHITNCISFIVRNGYVNKKTTEIMIRKFTDELARRAK